MAVDQRQKRQDRPVQGLVGERPVATVLLPESGKALLEEAEHRAAELVVRDCGHLLLQGQRSDAIRPGRDARARHSVILRLKGCNQGCLEGDERALRRVRVPQGGTPAASTSCRSEIAHSGWGSGVTQARRHPPAQRLLVPNGSSSASVVVASRCQL